MPCSVEDVLGEDLIRGIRLLICGQQLAEMLGKRQGVEDPEGGHKAVNKRESAICTESRCRNQGVPSKVDEAGGEWGRGMNGGMGGMREGMR